MRLALDGIRVDVGFGCGCVHFGFGICGMRHMLRIPTLDARCGYDVQLRPGFWIVDAAMPCGLGRCGPAMWVVWLTILRRRMICHWFANDMIIFHGE